MLAERVEVVQRSGEPGSGLEASGSGRDSPALEVESILPNGIQ